MARHTRSGVSGMSMWRTPRCASASTTAFCTAGVEPIVAASPIPFAPSGLRYVGVSVGRLDERQSRPLRYCVASRSSERVPRLVVGDLL